MIWIRKFKISPFSPPEIEKLHYGLWRLWTDNSSTVQDRRRMFARNFGVVEQCRNLPQTDPCCHGDENFRFL